MRAEEKPGVQGGALGLKTDTGELSQQVAFIFKASKTGNRSEVKAGERLGGGRRQALQQVGEHQQEARAPRPRTPRTRTSPSPNAEGVPRGGGDQLHQLLRGG